MAAESASSSLSPSGGGGGVREKRKRDAGKDASKVKAKKSSSKKTRKEKSESGAAETPVEVLEEEEEKEVPAVASESVIEEGDSVVVDQKRKNGEGEEDEEDEDAVVESKKDARKRKKRELKEQLLPAEEQERLQKKRAAKKEAGPKPEKGLNGIWVGNLSYFTTKDAVRAHFSACGGITRLHMPKANKEKSVGYAYVDFDTAEALANALALNESYLDRRALLIKPASDHTTTETAKVPRPETKLNSNPRVVAQQHRPTPTLFVGNLAFEATREQLRELFAAYGKIMKVRLSQWPDSGKCKGYAFVDFAELESAKAAIAESHKLHLDGRKLKLEFGSREAHERARPWEYKDQQQQQE